jgi:hypothetical protein
VKPEIIKDAFDRYRCGELGPAIFQNQISIANSCASRGGSPSGTLPAQSRAASATAQASTTSWGSARVFTRAAEPDVEVNKTSPYQKLTPQRQPLLDAMLHVHC